MTRRADPLSPDIGRRLRDERMRRSIGVRELSRQLDVSASMISQIETGRAMPSVSTLYAVTSALGISLDELFSGTPQEPGEVHRASGRSVNGHESPVQRADTRKRLSLGSGVHWELLTVQPQPDVEFLLATYEVGGESAPVDALSRHGGHEYGYVQDGHLGVTTGFESYELNTGDSISFSSSVPHRLFNLLPDRPSVAVWVVVGRRGDSRTEPAAIR